MIFELSPFARPAGYGEAIVPLADVKAHLSIDASEDEFDDLLEFYRDAAVEMVEDWCELKLGPATGLEWRGETFTEGMRIPDGPNLELVSAEWLDTAGAPVTGDLDLLRLGPANTIVAVPGQTWPTGVGGGVVVTYNAGFAAGECPAKLVQAVKMFAAHLFANREAVVSGVQSGEVPLGFQALCSRWKPVVL